MHKYDWDSLLVFQSLHMYLCTFDNAQENYVDKQFINTNLFTVKI